MVALSNVIPLMVTKRAGNGRFSANKSVASCPLSLLQGTSDDGGVCPAFGPVCMTAVRMSSAVGGAP